MNQVFKPHVALVGPPNSGKTTLYNWLTGAKSKTMNYPGSTVEISLGALRSEYHSISSGSVWMDTPGIYSLFPKSADEEVTRSALFDRPDVVKVVLVVDGTQLHRHLLLAKQLHESNIPFAIAVTMADLLRKQHLIIDSRAWQEEFGAPIVFVNGVTGEGVRALVDEIEKLELKEKRPLELWSETQMAAKRKRIQFIVDQSINETSREKLKDLYTPTAQMDRWLMHPVWGLLIFVFLMLFLFSGIFWMAKPLMTLVSDAFSGLSDLIISWSPQGLFARFLAHGVVDGLGSVFSFVPQIFILFIGIGILEMTGYLARAATLIDRPFSKVGLSGRSFVPMLSGFACAVPAVIATRNISSVRDRWITNFVIPLLTCSARLPVYAMLLSILLLDRSSWAKGAALAALYFGSLILAVLAAAILNLILKREGLSLFMMELPIYRRPRLGVLLKNTSERTLSYIKKAGPMIFLFSTLIWLGTNFPNSDMKDDGARLQQSYLGQFGQKIEPIFTPMGVDWRVGVGLMSAFVARETFVSSLSVLMGLQTPDVPIAEPQQHNKFIEDLQNAKTADGRRLFTFSHTLGMIIFFMLAMQCLSTFAIIAREMHSWKMAFLQLILFNVVAYIVTIAVVQGLNFVGIA